MRVALLTDGVFPYVIGGMQRHSFYLTKYLALNHVHVDLYHTNQSQHDISSLQCFTEIEKSYIRSFVVDFEVSDRFPGHYLRSSYAYSNKIYKLFIKNNNVDFIYIKGFAGWKLIEEKQKKSNTFPPIGINFHGYEMFQQQPSLKSWIESLCFFQGLVRYHLKQADYLFSYGGKITEIINSLGVPRSNIIELAAGIDFSWLNENELKNNSRRKFVFLGRYERRKGVEELNSVLKELLPNNDFEFIFVGPIPESKRISSPGVFYLGSVTDQDQLKTILQGADVLVCPSYSEGMPNVILEAMASGLAIIATDVGAVNVAVNARNGWLISPRSKPGLKKAMLEAMRIKSDQLMHMKKYSKQLIQENFLWNKIIGETISEIKKNKKINY